MEIKSLEKTNIDVICNAFCQAFADYEIQINTQELKTTLKRRGFQPDLSFAAFEGDDIVAFTLNGIGNYNEKKMAYDTSTGTLKEYRGKGLATKVFEYSIPYLKKANISHYLLEVLQNNTKAFSVYQNLGFEITRELNCFSWNNDEIVNNIKKIEAPCIIEKIDIEKHTHVSDFWDYEPSWQNSFESIRRTKEDFISLGACIDRNLVGYCVFEPNSGDITQLAVSKPFRRKGIASLLLHEIGKINKNARTKLINSDSSCSAVVDFLKAKNIDVSRKQYEMLKEIG